jgi:hypothetical protein
MRSLPIDRASGFSRRAFLRSAGALLPFALVGVSRVGVRIGHPSGFTAEADDRHLHRFGAVE